MWVKDPTVYLFHIRDHCEQAMECGAIRGRGDVPESILFSAVCRNLEIIGEAATRFDAEFRAAHPEIPWRKMISTRNILIHNYDDASPEIVWGIVEHDIPPLLAAVRKLIEGGPE